MPIFEKGLSLLTFHENNCRVLHWNSVGCHFIGSHKLAAKYYEKLGDMLDELTELAIVYGEKPVNVVKACAVLEACDDSHIIVNSDNEFSHKEVLENIVAISNEIYKELTSLQTSLPEDMKSQIDPMLEWFRVETFYKIGQMLKGEH